MAVPYEWLISSPPPDTFLREFPEINSCLLAILYRRNVRTQEAIDSYLKPDYSRDVIDPFIFQHMTRACDLIFDAIERQELITIHGDYDADGVCASSILKQTLDTLGAKTSVFLPHREKDGYGLNLKTIDYLHDNQTKLIITCDCGISNVTEIIKANDYGMKVIVTDHHQAPAELPPAAAIIHPKVPGEPYPFKELAGGGVAFKLVQGLLRDQRCRLSELDKEIHEKWLLDLVAISSIADMVSLLGETRLYTKFGLHVLRKNRRVGLKALFQIANIDPTTLDEQTVGFQIAPRINAAGRVDHANGAFVLLQETEVEPATEMAMALQQSNILRQRQTESMTTQALRQHDPETAVGIFFQADWPLGLTGLVAGKLVREYGKPCFVFGSDGEKIVGSGRSIAGVNILEPIRDLAPSLLSFGGHPQACGLRFLPEQFETIKASLQKWGVAKLQSGPIAEPLIIESLLVFSDIQWSLVDSLEDCAPYGMDNPQPVFATHGATVVSAVLVGKESKHLKLTLKQGDKTIPAIAFSQADSLPEVGSLIDIAYTLGINQWNGNREIQLQIISIKKHES